MRGPSVTPGYHGRRDLTGAAFDDEGFYRTGDAAELLDPARPEQGLRFAGRIAEDFKLDTATWVSSATARPGPKPISRTRSVGCTSSSETTHLLRWRLDGRCAMTQPATRPAAPRG